MPQRSSPSPESWLEEIQTRIREGVSSICAGQLGPARRGSRQPLRTVDASWVSPTAIATIQLERSGPPDVLGAVWRAMRPGDAFGIVTELYVIRPPQRGLGVGSALLAAVPGPWPPAELESP